MLTYAIFIKVTSTKEYKLKRHLKHFFSVRFFVTWRVISIFTCVRGSERVLYWQRLEDDLSTAQFIEKM